MAGKLGARRQQQDRRRGPDEHEDAALAPEPVRAPHDEQAADDVREEIERHHPEIDQLERQAERKAGVGFPHPSSLLSARTKAFICASENQGA